MSGRAILSLNGGSSSLKLCLHEAGERGDERLVARGAAEGIGQAKSRLWLRDAQGETLGEESGGLASHGDAFERLLARLHELGLPRPEACGHRVVHGGERYRAPARVDDELLESLRGFIPLAPLHLPMEIRLIEAARRATPELPQVACFDTAFHRRMPEAAQRLPLPRRLWESGIRRYGFHGLSYEYVLERLGEAGGGRLVVAHLGNGASLAALLDGRPMDTTMGLTPAGGLMMGTRTGDLDPGVVFYLLNQLGMDAAEAQRLLNRESGLAGVSGVSRDMRTLLERRAEDSRAAEAVELFCRTARKHIGALAAVLGGLDALVFTGGIGERAAEVRTEICAGLEHLGLRLDRDRNAEHADVISRDDSSCTARVTPTDEERMIARHTRTVAFDSGRR